MTTITNLIIKKPLFKEKYVNNTTVDRIYRYVDCNKEYIANFSIKDITITEGSITSITLSQEGTETTFDLTENEILPFLYLNTKPSYINLVSTEATGEELLTANSLIYYFIQLIIDKLGLLEEGGEENTGGSGGSEQTSSNTTEQNGETTGQTDTTNP